MVTSQNGLYGWFQRVRLASNGWKIDLEVVSCEELLSPREPIDSLISGEPEKLNNLWVHAASVLKEGPAQYAFGDSKPCGDTGH
jgi:hypothetical protein